MKELFDEIAGQPPLDPHDAVRQHTRAPQRKRFYRDVSVGQTDESWHILLDGKPIRTPTRKIVAAPNRALADAIAAEWQAQIDVLDPMTMPLTRLANSTTEGVIGNEATVADDMAKYFATDLLCYRAAHPAELVAREAAAWDGLLYWAAETFGAHFILAQGIVHAAQPPSAVAACRAALPTRGWPIAACHVVTTLTGSALLALALWRDARTADEVWNAAHIDEDWNTEKWGIDDEVAARRAMRLRDFQAAAAVIAATRPWKACA